MAYMAVSWAYEQKGLTPSEKFTLVTLAEHANASDWSCFPNISTLAKRTALSRTAIKTAIKSLKDMGLIKVENRMKATGGFTSSHYTLNRPDEGREATIDEGHEATIAKVGKRPTLGREATHPRSGGDQPYIEEPVKEPDTEPKRRVTEKMCESIYEKYPRKKGRGAALKAIRSAIKDFTFDALVSSVENFAAEWATRRANGDDIKFCPWPQKWFNEQRYRDEPDEEPTQANVGPTQPKEMSVWELKQLRDTLQDEAKQVRLKHCAEEAHFTSWDSPADKEQYLTLKGKVSDLNKRIGALAEGKSYKAPEIKVHGPVGRAIGDIAAKMKGEVE